MDVVLGRLDKLITRVLDWFKPRIGFDNYVFN
jgi:hypothetical protein